jgi:hypothetical protein
MRPFIVNRPASPVPYGSTALAASRRASTHARALGLTSSTGSSPSRTPQPGVIPREGCLLRRCLPLIQTPDSRNVECKNIDFPMGSRISQIWKAILGSWDALKVGLIKRLGNGQTTSIWNENWLPRSTRLRPDAPKAAHLEIGFRPAILI